MLNFRRYPGRPISARVRRNVFLGGVFLAASACVPLARPITAHAAQTSVSGVAADRVNAILAKNLALSPENATPTAFNNVVSISDADIMVQAQKLSGQAGHNGLYLDYFRFKAALDKVRATRADKLDIPAATYHIVPPQPFPNGAGLIEASNLSHVVIDGHGSTFLFRNNGSSTVPIAPARVRGGVRLGKSDHVTIRNLVLDWEDTLAVPVKVGQPGGSGSPLTLTVDRAFPVDPQAPIPITAFDPFDFARRHYTSSRDQSPSEFANWAAPWAPGGQRPYTCSSSNVGLSPTACYRFVYGQTYVFGPSEHFSPLPTKSDAFLGVAREGNYGAVVVDGGSTYVNLQNITIYTSPGSGISIVNAGRAIHLSNCRLVRKPDALLRPGEMPRYLSSISDGIDVISSAGDVVIDDSEFGFQGDDGLNTDAALAPAKATQPFELNAHSANVRGYYRAGGLVDVFDGKGQNLLQANVAIGNVKPTASAAQFLVDLTGLGFPLVPGSSYLLRVRDWDSSRVVVRNTFFHDNRARGVVLHGSDIAVVGSRFEGMTGTAVEVIYDDRDGHPEGPPANNIIIAGNQINDTNRQWFDPSRLQIAMPAGIAVYFESRADLNDGTFTNPGNLMASHIVISGNILTNLPGAGVVVTQANDVDISDNVIVNSGTHRFGKALIDNSSILLDHVANVHRSGGAVDRKWTLNN